MSRGGFRPGSGRKKGAKNRRTIERAEAIAGSGLDPLEYLTHVMNDQSAPEAVRLEAAKSLAPFVHPKKASVEVTRDQEYRSPEELEQDLVNQARSDPQFAQQLLEMVATVARANPVVMAQLRSILDGPQPVMTGTELSGPS